MEFEQQLERHRKLLGLKAEEAQLRMLDSVADLAEAKAEEAAHRAAAEPRRQTMSLRERAVKLRLVVVVTLSAIGLAIAALVVNPWFLSLGLPPTAVGAWKWFEKEKEDHKPPSDDKGGP